MHHTTIVKVAAVTGMMLCVMLVAALPAGADSVYHAQHIALMSDTGASVGFVQNIHANGPTIYAQERYVLLGADPGTYAVALNIYMTPDMSDVPLVLPSAEFTTNALGNGVGRVTFDPAAADGLRGNTVYIVWTVSSADVTYHTSLQTVVLD